MAEQGDVKRWIKADLQAFVANEFKKFCKEKCAECGKPATKRFSTSMSVVVTNMVDSFWCPECGRVLCEAHRYQHRCERLDQQKERNKHLTHEQLAARIAEAEALKESIEEEKKARERTAAEEREKLRLERKNKRQILAHKAKCVEDFLQGVARDTEANERRGPHARDELFELYTRAKRISLTLYNEFEHPTMTELAEEDWGEIKRIYDRSKELTGMYVRVEDGPLDMGNPWDPPAPAGPADDTDGAGFGRGLV